VPTSQIRPSAEIARLLEDQVTAPRVASHAVAGVLSRGSDGVYRGVFGTAGHAHWDTIFDLASISKPLLAVLLARWIEEGRLTWQTQLGSLLPRVDALPAATETLEALLSHRAGLRAHIELFRDSWSGRPVERTALLRRAAAAVRPDQGRDALYSDLGYLLVGAGLEDFAGQPLDVLLADTVTTPLGLEIGSARAFRRTGAFSLRAAPTEIQPGRGGLLRGVVHDDNAWALAGGGYAGHAGAFGTLAGLLDFGRHLLEAAEGRGPLGGCLADLVAPRPGGSLRLGFDGPSGSNSTAGPGASPKTFGHLGFTGTSLWCDPEARACTVLLTNRVYPSRDEPRIRPVRLEVQRRLWQLAGTLGEQAGDGDAPAILAAELARGANSPTTLDA
jgi:CubicO group peptidase (beta-lactamase class C family)